MSLCRRCVELACECDDLVFTDDDLKRLKSHNNLLAEDNTGNPHCTVPCDRIDALLARLEAAEKVCKVTAHMRAYFPLSDKAEAALEAWRKSKGVLRDNEDGGGE